MATPIAEAEILQRCADDLATFREVQWPGREGGLLKIPPAVRRMARPTRPLPAQLQHRSGPFHRLPRDTTRSPKLSARKLAVFPTAGSQI